jgi:hypothetical protein
MAFGDVGDDSKGPPGCTRISTLSQQSSDNYAFVSHLEVWSNPQGLPSNENSKSLANHWHT